MRIVTKNIFNGQIPGIFNVKARYEYGKNCVSNSYFGKKNGYHR
jgi:hypothetical protein